MNPLSQRVDSLKKSEILLPYLNDNELNTFIEKYKHLHTDRISILPKDCKFFMILYLDYFDIIKTLSVNKTWMDLKNNKRYAIEWRGLIRRRLGKMRLNINENFHYIHHFCGGAFKNLYDKYNNLGIEWFDLYLFVVWVDNFGKHLWHFTNLKDTDFQYMYKIFGAYRIWLHARQNNLTYLEQEEEWTTHFVFIPPFNTSIRYFGPVDAQRIYRLPKKVFILFDLKPSTYITYDELYTIVDRFIANNFISRLNDKFEATSYKPMSKTAQWMVTRKKCTYKDPAKKKVKWKIFKNKDKLIQRISDKLYIRPYIYFYHDVSKIN